jgi:Regulator of Chromosome Condensation (RCC1) repeat protein/lectin-like protein
MRKILPPLGIFFLIFPTGAIAQQDSIASWGDDSYGQVANTPNGTNFIQVASGGGSSHSLALRPNGTILSWGLDNYGQVSNTPTGAGFIQLGSGFGNSLALHSNGSISSWGRDTEGQVSNTPTGFDFIQVAGGASHSLALHSDGSISSWGTNSYSLVSNSPTGAGFISVAAGLEHSFALRADGSIVAWGRDDYGGVSNTPTGSGFLQVAGGWLHSLALRSDGSLVSWGYNGNGQVSNTPTGLGFVRVACGELHSLALKDDGTIVSWGYDGQGQISNTPTGSEFIMISGGRYHSLALLGNDSDADGLRDSQEDLNENGQVDPGESDPFDQDTDDDGLGDGEEANDRRVDTRWLLGPSGDYYRLAPADTWSNASAAARAQGYELTSVQDQAEADWLFQTFGEIRGNFWIGLNDFSGTLEWSDGSPVAYTQWATGEPNTSFIATYIGDQATAEPGNWYGDFAGLASFPAVWEAPGPNAPKTATDPLSWDTDGDGLSDGMEDGVDTIYWDGHGIPGVSGTDPGVFIPDADPLTTTDPLDLDSDEDGIADGIEDLNGDGAVGIGETDASLVDTDGDSLPDGLELGLISGTLDTNGSIFAPDADPLSTTDPLTADTDGGGVDDGIEDQSQDGGVNTWETDPNNGVDEELAFYVSNFVPGLRVHFEVYNASPLTGIFPAYSLTGAGPTPTTLGIDVALSLPISVLDPFLTDIFGRASINSVRVPASIPPGLPVWIQAVEVPISSTLLPRASNPILLPVGSN